MFISSRSESPSQVFFIILTWLIALLNSAAIKPEGLQAMYLAYDNLCRLKVSRKSLPLTPPLNRAWLHIKKIIDIFHLHSHPKDWRRTTPMLTSKLVSKCSFGWLISRTLSVQWIRLTTYSICIVWCEGETVYTAKCYANGRKPVLPRAKSPKADN